ncbi:Crp/Fnr family transcriptional regulator [Phenylobacterium sp. J367]|uniref:Crp/Fnr family transcriptional regulator n=1 Tax=Phenylobacterium sp. J367 TaxID=2898435 RepID=UPI002150F2A0|nr:Crp/Fnr family transcriptional regulator [Phenylobacterium sp. J367]MCR5880813.1 Crp/Fnr family transcriptional regulator [Phenylobacterium sp. J367]
MGSVAARAPAAPPTRDGGVLLRRLTAHAPLAPAEIQALGAAASGGVVARRPAGALIVAEGDRNPAQVIVRGWAAAFRILPQGRRQIFRLLLPGDIIGLGAAPARWSVAALTALETQSAEAVLDLARSGQAPGVLRALGQAMREEERLMLDQIVRVGQLTALERMAHLLLEVRDRLAAVGLTEGQRFPLPATQEVLADLLGLSIVHVNRVLRTLRESRVVACRQGVATVLDAEALARLARDGAAA